MVTNYHHLGPLRRFNLFALFESGISCTKGRNELGLVHANGDETGDGVGLTTNRGLRKAQGSRQA